MAACQASIASERAIRNGSPTRSGRSRPRTWKSAPADRVDDAQAGGGRPADVDPGQVGRQNLARVPANIGRPGRGRGAAPGRRISDSKGPPRGVGAASCRRPGSTGCGWQRATSTWRLIRNCIAALRWRSAPRRWWHRRGGARYSQASAPSQALARASPSRTWSCRRSAAGTAGTPSTADTTPRPARTPGPGGRAAGGLGVVAAGRVRLARAVEVDREHWDRPAPTPREPSPGRGAMPGSLRTSAGRWASTVSRIRSW